MIARVRAALAPIVRAGIWLIDRWPTTARAFDVLPAFPLRCQHCTEALEMAKAHPSERRFITGHDGPLFRDQSGRITCDREHRIPHKPMPSVLG